MDKFKPLRTDTIPLKTFTYRETPVVEIKRPRTSFPVVIPRSSKSSSLCTVSKTSNPSDIHMNNTNPVEEEEEEAQLMLPRHLTGRETRSNSDYLRMMASELEMIRARKLIAPLKPRGFLPRRRELFRHVKSSLNIRIGFPSDVHNHPLNNDNIFGCSWSSVASSDSFLSTTSSDYITADEDL
ncbi:hypothetical protein BG004_007387 [Podila humilis]|nr:hypothetical protein BG004_007387 [Podila humilis]